MSHYSPIYTTYAYQNPRKSYPVLPSTSEVNESDIHILNKRFEKKIVTNSEALI